MFKILKKRVQILVGLVVMGLSTGIALANFNNYQGFETDTVDWVASQGITRVSSGGGSLHLTANSGNYYAELQNLLNGYSGGFGDGGYSRYGGNDTIYHGDFYQAISVYIDVNWSPTLDTYDPDIWIDMTPYHADPSNYGAEHNFRLTATGANVLVRLTGLLRRLPH
jgi:hypothetical protein